MTDAEIETGSGWKATCLSAIGPDGMSSTPSRCESTSKDGPILPVRFARRPCLCPTLRPSKSTSTRTVEAHANSSEAQPKRRQVDVA